MTCPNINNPDWIELVKRVGEDKAYELYALNNETIPDPYQFTNINEKDIPISKQDLNSFAKNFFKKFGVNFEIITEEKATKKGLSDRTKGIYDVNNNKVYLVEGRASQYTVLHEFTHPFVLWLSIERPLFYKTMLSKLKNKYTEQSLVEKLKNDGYGENMFTPDGNLSVGGWMEALTQEIENVSVDLNNNSKLKEDSIINSVLKFWKFVVDKLKDFFPSLKISSFNEKNMMNWTFKDLSILMMQDEFTLNLRNVHLKANEVGLSGPYEFEKRSSDFQKTLNSSIFSYKERTGKDLSDAQVSSLKKIFKHQHLEVDPNDEKFYYNSKTNTKYKRATQYLKELEGPNGELEFYEYHAEEDLGKKAREWGNQVDDLLTLIIENTNKEDSIAQVNNNHTERVNNGAEEVTISEEILSDLYDKLKDLIDTKYKNYLILPQVILADDKNGVAGSLDLLLIDELGRVRILDLKTTSKSTQGTEYTKQYGNSASKKQTHTGQLSIYRAMALSNGLILNSNDLTIIPIYLDYKSTDNEISNAYLEPEVNLSAYDYISKKFNISESENTDQSNEYNDEQVKTINKIKIALVKRLKTLKKQTDNYKNRLAISNIENTLEVINTSEPIKKLSEFINLLHNQFNDSKVTNSKTGKSYVNLGLASQIRKLTLDLSANEIKPEEAISKFLYIKNIVTTYSPLMDELRVVINEYKDQEFKSELYNKLEDIQQAIAYINNIYNKETVDLMADFLMQGVSSEANKKVEEYLTKIKDRSTTEKQKLDYERQVRKLKSEKGVTREVIVKALKEGSSSDIPWIDLWFTPAASSSNEIIGPFSRILKDKMEDARQKIIDFERSAGQMYERFKSKSGKNPDIPSNFNEGLYEKVSVFEELDSEGNPVFKEKMSFISEIDYNKFNQEKAKYKQRIAKAKTPQEAALIKNQYFKDNFVRRPQSEDIYVTNPITKEKVIILESIDTLINRKRKLFEQGLISEFDLNNYIKQTYGYEKDGVTYYNSDFIMVNSIKFKNSKFENLKRDSAKKEYYDFLISSYFKAQSRLPHKMGYILPSIKKSGFDSATDKGLINHLKYTASNLVNFKDEDVERYGSEGNTIPLVYNFDMSADDVSLNLIESITLYEAESLEYEVKDNLVDSSSVLLDMVSNTAPFKTDDNLNKYIDSVVEKAGIKDEYLKYVKKVDGNNVAALLSMYIDAQIYGKLNIPAKVGGLSIDKISDSLMRFASITQVGGNPIGSAANYMQAAIQTNIEAAAKQYISDKSWLQSRVEYDKRIGDFIKDFLNPYSKSFLGQLVDIYDPLQGEFRDAAGRKLSKSALKRMWSTNSWFFFQHIGEHSVQIRTMIAMMLETKIKTDNGKVINLLEAYELDKNTGKIKLREGITLPGKLSENGLISRSFQARLHALNKRLQGVYNKQDKTAIERFWYGRLLMMYKKFLVPGFKRRYKSLSIDQEFEDFNEGYMITFYKRLRSDFKETSRFLLGMDTNYFTPHEKENLRRARREMLIVFTSGLAIMLLSGMMESADDDEKKILKKLLYLSLRLNGELGLYGIPGDPTSALIPNPKEIYRTAKNPFIAMSVLDKFAALLQQLTDPTAVYERDSGVFEKGDSKLWAKFLKFWGLNGLNYDPENSIKYMQMNR